MWKVLLYHPQQKDFGESPTVCSKWNLSDDFQHMQNKTSAICVVYNRKPVICGWFDFVVKLHKKLTLKLKVV